MRQNAKRGIRAAVGAVVGWAALAAGAAAHAQVAPAATGPLGLSVFGGATGTFTGYNGGKNLGITAGADLDLLPIWGLHPALEARATYPAHQGSWVGEKSVLGGIREPFQVPGFARFHLQPYADVLFGYGRLAYPGGGELNPNATFVYFHTSGFTYEPGAGAKLRLNAHWAIQGDFQLQHFSTPVTTSGRIWSVPITGAVVYRFDRYHDTSPWRPVR